MKKRSNRSNPRDYKGLDAVDKEYLEEFDRLEREGYCKRYYEGSIIEGLDEEIRERYYIELKQERNGRRRDLLSKRGKIRRMFEGIE